MFRRDRREFPKDNIAVKTVEHYLTSRVNASIGIAKNTKDVDAVVEFLGLLYGNGKYADILLYGQEGTDYKVVDGVACNTDGTDLEDDYLSKLCLDLFINVYPVTGERYMENRKDEFLPFMTMPEYLRLSVLSLIRRI